MPVSTSSGATNFCRASVACAAATTRRSSLDEASRLPTVVAVPWRVLVDGIRVASRAPVVFSWHRIGEASSAVAVCPRIEPKGSVMKRCGTKRPTRTVLDSLGAAEQAALLEELLATYPDLVAEAERRAGAMLETASRSDTAAEVVDALQALELEDMAVRAGYQPGRGYVHEVEAAGELVEEALKPFLADVRLRAGPGGCAPSRSRCWPR
jgi:hypothetical protein